MVDARSVDPFENPPQALRIASLPPDHFLVLNKFAVVPEHFILATTAFKPQTHLLEAADLAAAYACIEAYHGAGQELFAFFNSGDHSGASQPHRHIQMLPVERMRDGLNACEDGAKWELLAERLVGEDLSLPFTTFAESLRPDVSPDSLRDIYLSLYRKACAASDVNAEGSTEGEARICYNVGMTRNVMALCQRTAEGSFIRAAPDKLDKVGNVAMNGTVLAGTALVKGQEEWEALCNDPEHRPAARCGFRSTRRARAAPS